MPFADRLGNFACDLPILGVRGDLGVDVVADKGAEAVVFGFVVEGVRFGKGELGEERLGEWGRAGGSHGSVECISNGVLLSKLEASPNEERVLYL